MISPISYDTSDEFIASPDLKNEDIAARFASGFNSLLDSFINGIEQSHDGPCLGWRPSPDLPYVWLSYKMVLQRCQYFGSGLLLIDAKHEQSQFIGIIANNRVEWKIVELACSFFSMILVPILTTATQDQTVYIINQCELNIIVVDTVEKVKFLLEECQKRTISLRIIIVMDKEEENLQQLSANFHVTVKWFSEIELFGKHSLQEFVVPKPHYINTIVYTSGTAGSLKGVVLTHKNFIAEISALNAHGQLTDHLSHKDVYYSFLQLSHVAERILTWRAFNAGARVGFLQGSKKTLITDAQELKPTFISLIPQFMNKLHELMRTEITHSYIERFALKIATKAKTKQYQRGNYNNDTFWDKVFFQKFRDILGGNLRFAAVTMDLGVPVDVINFVEIALGVPLYRGYWVTEACGIAASTLAHDFSGAIGSPVMCNYIKLADVTEMGLVAQLGKGEICIKGSNVFKNYYKDEINTTVAIDKENWFHTGDIGSWTKDGTLKVVGRKEDIYKLSLSHTIVAEKVEEILTQSSLISQILIHADSMRSTVVAIVVVHEETVRRMFDVFQDKLLKSSKRQKVKTSNTKLKRMILEDLHKIGKKYGLIPIEVPKNILVTNEPFTVSNGLLSPNSKKERAKITVKYHKEIQQLFKEISVN